MYDDTFNVLGIQCGGVHPPRELISFWNFGTGLVKQSFHMHIFKSKPHTPLASPHAQMTHFELGSDSKGQSFGILKQFLSF